MHLPTGPTAVYHPHHYHLPSSPPQSDWNSNITSNSKSNNIILDSQNSTSGTASPPGSTASSQDLWWTERLVLEAQQEFPNELGNLIRKLNVYMIISFIFLLILLRKGDFSFFFFILVNECFTHKTTSEVNLISFSSELKPVFPLDILLIR